MKSPAQYPLATAALVALCGVVLIVFSSVWPTSTSGNEAQKAASEQLHERHLHALAELRTTGFSGAVDVVDFGDGLGLGVSHGMERGAVVLTVPETLALDVTNTRSCPGDTFATAIEAGADCLVERAVVKAVSRQEASRLTGLLALLVMEKRRGLVSGLEPNAGSAVLGILPDPSWQAEDGIFAVDSEEFRVMSAGTSMEGWRDVAVNETAKALIFLQTASFAASLGGDASLEEVRWAYLVLHAHGQWMEDEGLDDGVELPSQVLFLWPLFLARPTPEWQHGVKLRYNADQHVYEVVATRPMRPAEELLFVDRRLSDASALCFRGLWLAGRHRARLSFNVSGVVRDPQSQPILKKYGCGAQPLKLYVQARKSIDPHFLSCMRMLALASNASKLQRVERSGWMKSWPDTNPVGRQTETAAAGLAINVLQQVLNRLGSSSAEIRQRYGGDAVATRPTVRVRESETMVVVGLLKSMKELQLLSGNEYLFDALHEKTKKKKGSGKSGHFG